MELVKSISIGEPCDGQRLTAPPRLEVLVSVCEVVQHAHGKGLIHRDLTSPWFLSEGSRLISAPVDRTVRVGNATPLPG